MARSAVRRWWVWAPRSKHIRQSSQFRVKRRLPSTLRPSWFAGGHRTSQPACPICSASRQNSNGGLPVVAVGAMGVSVAPSNLGMMAPIKGDCTLGLPRWAWFCSRCGVRNLPRVLHCLECRHAFVGPPSVRRSAVTCGPCGARNPGDASYCESCGKRLPPVGTRPLILPASTGPVEGLYMGRDVALRDAELRKDT